MSAKHARLLEGSFNLRTGYNHDKLIPAPFPGLQLNPFLVLHKKLAGPGYTITHLPTGLTILPGSIKYTRKDLLLKAPQLMALDWDFTYEQWQEQPTPPQILGTLKQILKIVHPDSN